MSGESVSVHM